MDDFLWGVQPNGREWWSTIADNDTGSGGFDHLITYMIQEAFPTGETVWMLFWEDLDSPGWDQDYNDIVVELRATALPEPSAFLLLGAGLLGLGLARRTRSSA